MRIGPAIAIIIGVAAVPAAGQAPERVAIHHNQLGFEPDGPKLAVLESASRVPIAWRLVDAGGATVAAGRTEPLGNDAASGGPVHLIDFASVTTPDTGYRLHAGDATGRPFAIAAAPRGRLAQDALAYFYHNRAGVPIEARFAGGERWARPAGHPREVVTCFSGADQRGNRWPGCDYRLDVTGGWYDAGDHGKYVVNGGISLWTLLNLYERGAERGLASPFADGQVAIPEAGNGVDDLLDHARYQMDFMLAMQVPDGARVAVAAGQRRVADNLRIAEIDAGGMAHHKIADREWTAIPLAPHEDREDRLLYPPSTAATLNLAATAAQCARLWRTIDAAYAARCLDAARRAWAAAERHPEVFSVGDFTGSGGYGDDDVSDEFFWAASELYLTTREAPFLDAVRASPHLATEQATEASWANVATLGHLSLILHGDELPVAEAISIHAALLTGADGFLADRARVGYRIPQAPDYVWGSAGGLMNRAIILATAHDLTDDPRYRAGVIDAIDYLLGRNPNDVSYVSGYGHRAMVAPHQRFWAHAVDPRYPPPPSGALSGGPNNRNMSDPVAQTLRGRCAPMRCWADDTAAYALNEVTINWNAPLVWVATWLDEGNDNDRPGGQ